MNVAALQKVDRWIGVPLCFFLTLLRKLFGRAPEKTDPIRRLLLIKLAEQGSTVLAYQAIDQAVKMVGRENVYFILFEENRFILETFGLLPEENIISLPTKNFLQMARS
ncbi:MAG: hypothetical protein ACR2H1_15245, partial [Limisphaerales bacterium]